MAELTKQDADEILEKIAEYEAEIAAAEKERDAFISRYQEKITRAQEICEESIRAPREEIALLTEQLRQYAAANVTDKKRTIPLPSGTLSFRKQAPKYFFDGREATADNPALLDFTKKFYCEYLKTKEYVDWSKFKAQLVIDGDNVLFAETGEVIDGLRAQILPDKFTIKTN